MVIRKIEPTVSARRKRVAAYARVSMESESMANSLAAQMDYFRKKIENNPEWEFAGI